MVQPDLFGSTPGARVYTVTQINDRVRRLLDSTFGDVCVEGEVSNARRHASGHWYFTLKDAQSQLAAVLFRGDARALAFDPENGLHVRATGRLDLYPPQGKFQLQVRRLQPVGHGALELAFRQLKEKLLREGLFDPARKRSLPRVPNRVALVTSATGAAVRDMITTLSERWPPITIRVVPVSVQGDAAPAEIVRALQFVNRVDAADVIVVGRGGGSLEDLWAFNDEGVARAIAASRIPVVSAVGHEVDTTIADYVADVRAPTPTAAAALVVPQREEVQAGLSEVLDRMARGLRRRCDVERHRLESRLGSYGFRRPRLLLQEHAQSLDTQRERMLRALRARIDEARTQLRASRAQLRSLSPRGVLKRGYVYCIDMESGAMVTRAQQTRSSQPLRLHFADGTAAARVEESWTPYGEPETKQEEHGQSKSGREARL
ncbi:MAG: exodeoxyribonuclease VII large subunit [Candidatus Latescibacterota bacterium]|nr:MAG: exodeoxyribonuclease VII large subunit [Candidatus Latescibacterota bacterium]